MTDTEGAQMLAILIRNGDADADLDAVQSALNSRRNYLDSLAALEMTPGARIRVIPTPGRPHVTDNATGYVDAVKRTRVHVTLDQHYRNSKKWQFTASQLECLD